MGGAEGKGWEGQRGGIGVGGAEGEGWEGQRGRDRGGRGRGGGMGGAEGKWWEGQRERGGKGRGRRGGRGGRAVREVWEGQRGRRCNTHYTNHMAPVNDQLPTVHSVYISLLPPPTHIDTQRDHTLATTDTFTLPLEGGAKWEGRKEWQRPGSKESGDTYE